MNPAGLKTNLKDLVEGGTLIVNTGAFIEANLKKAGYASNPLEDGSLDKYKVHAVDINHLTMAALEGSELSNKEKGRAKNFFALGLVFWMYGREPEAEIRRIHQQFAKKPGFGEANVKVFKAGYHYGETAEVFQTVYKVPPHSARPACIATSPATRRSRSGSSSAPSSPARSCSTRAIRSRPRRRSSTRSRSTRTSAR